MKMHWNSDCEEALKRIERKACWVEGECSRLLKMIHEQHPYYDGMMFPLDRDRVDLGVSSALAEVLIVGRGNSVPELPLDICEPYGIRVLECSEEELVKVDELFPGARLHDWVCERLEGRSPAEDLSDEPVIDEEDEKEIAHLLARSLTTHDIEAFVKEHIRLRPVLKMELERSGVLLHHFEVSEPGFSLHKYTTCEFFNVICAIIDSEAPRFRHNHDFSDRVRLLKVILAVVAARFVEEHEVRPFFFHEIF